MLGHSAVRDSGEALDHLGKFVYICRVEIPSLSLHFLSFVNLSSINSVPGNGQASNSVPTPQSPVARTTPNPVPAESHQRRSLGVSFAGRLHTYGVNPVSTQMTPPSAKVRST
jgi:hypothetical protein